ncbi:MAG: manganese catalase family protein [Oscillospiraceae bacterium]|nr:manganese catalase family protein [Oscillospiraceae bacterium]
MFVYEKKLQYPVRIKNSNPKLAAVIISQYGGPYRVRLRTAQRRKALSPRPGPQAAPAAASRRCP